MVDFIESWSYSVGKETKRRHDLKIDLMEKELEKIITNYDLPSYRKTTKTIHNYRWLFKNIEKRNSAMKNLKRAMEILDFLQKNKK